MTYTQLQDEAVATFIDHYLYADDELQRTCVFEARALRDGLIALLDRKSGRTVALAREGNDDVPRLLWIQSVAVLSQLEDVSEELIKEINARGE